MLSINKLEQFVIRAYVDECNFNGEEPVDLDLNDVHDLIVTKYSVNGVKIENDDVLYNYLQKILNNFNLNYINNKVQELFYY